MIKRTRLNPKDREISALKEKELRDKKRAMRDERNSVTRTPAPGGVVQVLLVEIVSTSTSNIYLAQTQEGTIWGNTPSHPDQNGDHCLMRIYPEKEIDTRWEVQEVVPWGMDSLMETLPKNTRWFIPV